MVLVWRGAGILVPILIFIVGMLAAWLSPGDPKIFDGNIWWWISLICAPIFLLLGFVLRMPDEDEQGNKTYKKHDFFWIPVWIWGIVMLGVFVKVQFFTGDDSSSSSSSDTVSSSDMPAGPEEVEEAEVDRVIHFYNPTKDTLLFEVADSGAVSKSNTDGVIERRKVAPMSVRDAHFGAGSYIIAGFNKDGDIFQMIPDEENLGEMDLYESYKGEDGNKYHHRILGKPTPEADDYDEAWVSLDGKTGFVLVNVTTACAKDAAKDAILKADWSKSIQEEYAANDLVEPLYKMYEKGKNTRVVGPGQKLPAGIEENDSYFLLIPKVGKLDNKAIAKAIVEARF